MKNDKQSLNAALSSCLLWLEGESVKEPKDLIIKALKDLKEEKTRKAIRARFDGLMISEIDFIIDEINKKPDPSPDTSMLSQTTAMKDPSFTLSFDKDLIDASKTWKKKRGRPSK